MVFHGGLRKEESLGDLLHGHALVQQLQDLHRMLAEIAFGDQRCGQVFGIELFHPFRLGVDLPEPLLFWPFRVGHAGLYILQKGHHRLALQRDDSHKAEFIGHIQRFQEQLLPGMIHQSVQHRLQQTGFHNQIGAAVLLRIKQQLLSQGQCAGIVPPAQIAAQLGHVQVAVCRIKLLDFVRGLLHPFFNGRRIVFVQADSTAQGIHVFQQRRGIPLVHLFADGFQPLPGNARCAV